MRSFTKIRRKRKIRGHAFSSVVVMFALLACISACSSLDYRAFERYRDAFFEIEASTDAALAADYKWTYESYLRRVEEGDSIAVFNLLLSFPDSNYYDWNLRSDAFFLKIENTRKAFRSLSEAFAGYTILLAQLASGSLVNVEEFGELTNELNDNAFKAAKALKIKKSPQQTALFSTVAVELARLYIENRRRKHLARIITDNQELIEEFSERAVELVGLIAQDIKAAYNHQIERWIDDWRNPAGKSKRKIVEEIVSMNDELIIHLNGLEVLERSYKDFARKHKELGVAVSKGNLNGFDVSELLRNAKRLRRIYRELNKALEKKE